MPKLNKKELYFLGESNTAKYYKQFIAEYAEFSPTLDATLSLMSDKPLKRTLVSHIKNLHRILKNEDELCRMDYDGIQVAFYRAIQCFAYIEKDLRKGYKNEHTPKSEREAHRKTFLTAYNSFCSASNYMLTDRSEGCEVIGFVQRAPTTTSSDSSTLGSIAEDEVSLDDITLTSAAASSSSRR